MAKRKKKKRSSKSSKSRQERLHPDAKTSIVAVSALGLSVVLVLASFDKAGPAGVVIYDILEKLFGWGYFLVPAILIILGLGALANIKRVR